MSNTKPFWKEESNLFVVKIAALYGGWKVLHHFLKSPSSGALYAFWNSFTISYGIFYAKFCSAVLNLFGEVTIQNSYAIQYVASQKAVLVEEHCLAIPGMIVFTGAIAFFSGDWKNKLWFIPLGLLAIFLINATRITLLVVTYEYSSPAFFHFNHSYVYVVFTYSMIFLFVIWWMKRFSDTPPKDKGESAIA